MMGLAYIPPFCPTIVLGYLRQREMSRVYKYMYINLLCRFWNVWG